jgi:signal peptidase II
VFRTRKFLVFVSVFAVGLLIDQATKIWVYTQLAYNKDEINVIPGFLSIVHAQNPGAAMGLLRDFEYRQQLFGIFTIIAVGVIIDLFRRLPKRDWFMSLVLGLIMSGAVGNGIDRVHKQTVTDFIRVYTEHPSLSNWLIKTVGTNEWPSFNIADSSLVVGVSLFMLHYLIMGDTEDQESDEIDEAADGADVEEVDVDDTDLAAKDV